MANGNLPNTPGILHKPASHATSANNQKASVKRSKQLRLKILIRRLPPGLTQDEFFNHLGQQWKVGGGKVDWLVYRHGKVSRDPAKPSRPGRAYLHVVDVASVQSLSDQVKQISFQDAKNTMRDLALLGPPVVEFAPYTKIPALRKRKDARQGTIDQDPEFMAFLNSLTDPIKKPSVDLEPSPKPERWTTTPLIEHIREKKAKKEKAPAAKAGKKDAKEAPKAKSKDATAQSISSGSKDKSAKQGNAPQAKDAAAKELNRTDTGAAESPPVSNTTNSATAAEEAKKAVPERRRERPVAQFNLAAKIQRDLGLKPAPRRVTSAAKDATNESPVSVLDKKCDPAASATTSADAASATRRDSRGRDRRNSKPPRPASVASSEQPAIQARAPVNTPTKPISAPSTKDVINAKTKSVAAPTSSASHTNRAFIKHANASQGVTEALLLAALTAFGSVSKVEIDQKRGTAFADFASSQGLASAVAKGKVDVGKATVVIAEYRDRPVRNPRATAAPPASTTTGNVPASPSLSGNMDSSRGRGGRGRGGRGRAASAQAQGQKPTAAVKFPAPAVHVPANADHTTNG